METKPNSSIYIDRLYEGKLDYEEIRKHPILQPISEVSSTYESHSLNIQMAMSEFNRIKEDIQKMIELNDDYSQTMIVMKMQEIIMYARQVIHSQDLQRESIKKMAMDMIRITQKYYESKESSSENKFPISEMDKIIQTKTEEVQTEEEKELENIFDIGKKEDTMEEIENTKETEIEEPKKKKGRPKKEEEQPIET